MTDEKVIDITDRLNARRMMRSDFRRSKAMFYHYDQNNSGGGFVVDDRVTFNVIIEADSPEDANQRAQEVGIYFDYNYEWQDGMETPMIYGTPVEDHKEPWSEPGKPYAYVYYKDGGQVSYSRTGDAK